MSDDINMQGSGHGNLRFDCVFAEKGMRKNVIFAIAYLCVMVMVIGVALAKSMGFLILIPVVVFLSLVSVWIFRYTNKLSRESYLEITADGKLNCIFKGRSSVSYPINEIQSVEESSSENADKKYATVPVVVNSRGWEVYPEKGVLITFNRAWHKSVFPVFFNPADVQGFIAAIKSKMESMSDSSDVHGADCI